MFFYLLILEPSIVYAYLKNILLEKIATKKNNCTLWWTGQVVLIAGYTNT